MTKKELEELAKEIHMAKVAHSDGYIEMHVLDAAASVLMEISKRLKSEGEAA